jgi:predicted SAM-dependent methyltransferase
VFTSPRGDEQQFTINYESVEDPLYLQERPAREITFKKHLNHLEKYTGQGVGRRLLDVGAYIGVFIEAANATGWRASGIEPSDWAVRVAQTNELDVIQGFFPPSEDVFQAESFDVITMWDVIEHVTDPDATLRAAFKLLKPGGWIAVHTMDIDSLLSKVMGKRWPWLMEMHIYYFSRRTLGKMLENAGFELMQVKPEGRYLRLKYLVTRLRPYSKALADFVEWVTGLVGLDEIALPINFGDLVTAYAYKPEQ